MTKAGDGEPGSDGRDNMRRFDDDVASSSSAGHQRELSFGWNGLQLAGTLHLPDRLPPYPAVLMLQGSGPEDRDSAGYFNPIRNAFLSRGLASFSFDKPGVGASTGDWHDFDLAARADQAVAALNLLRSQEDIDPTRVGVWGHSQGGWLVQMLAARLPDLAFAIANSGPAISVERQNLAGCEHTLRAQGKSEAEIAAALELLMALHEAGRRGEDFGTVDAWLLQAARDQPWYGYFPLEDPADWRLVSRLIQEAFEPLEALGKVGCPFLAIFGAHDRLVPAWESAELTSRALGRAGNDDSCVIVFPTGDHRIQEEATDEFVTGYLDLLGGWAARHVGLQER